MKTLQLNKGTRTAFCLAAGIVGIAGSALAQNYQGTGNNFGGGVNRQ